MPQSSDQPANERPRFPAHFTFAQSYGYGPLAETMQLEQLFGALWRKVWDATYLTRQHQHLTQECISGDQNQQRSQNS